MTGSATGDPGRAAYLRHVLSLLYPAPLEVVTGRRRDAVRGYLALPPGGAPRIAVPAGARSVAAAAIRRQLTGSRPRTRLARSVLAAGTAGGLLDRVAPRLSVVGPAGSPSVEGVLAEAVGVPDPLVTLPVGPPRANRKPVLQVVSARGGRDVRAFVKVGHTDLTRALVRAEADALARVAAAAPTVVVAPTVRALRDWRGLALLVLDPLPVAAGAVPARELLLAAVRDVAALGTVREVGFGGSAYRRSLLERLQALAAGGTDVAELQAEVEAVGRRLPAVTVGAWHGDLNPGNLAPDVAAPHQRARRLLVWDWERFGAEVPLGFDLLHHDLARAITVADEGPTAAARALLADASTTLAPLGVDPPAAADVARLYLVEIAVRYLSDDQAAAGADLGDVGRWLLPALRGPRREVCA